MGGSSITYVVVPGLGGSGPGHWQSLFAEGRADVVYVRQADWERPLRRAWVRGLEDALAKVEGRAVLIAHSLGVMTVAHWAARMRSDVKISGALLVAPPDLEAPRAGIPPRWLLFIAGWAPVPMRKLPFPAIVVGSADDPMCAPGRARQLAASWGAEFHDLGLAGHVNPASGYGVWRGLEGLLQTLAG